MAFRRYSVDFWPSKNDVKNVIFLTHFKVNFLMLELCRWSFHQLRDMDYTLLYWLIWFSGLYLVRSLCKSKKSTTPRCRRGADEVLTRCRRQLNWPPPSTPRPPFHKLKTLRFASGNYESRENAKARTNSKKKVEQDGNHMRQGEGPPTPATLKRCPAPPIFSINNDFRNRTKLF